MRLGLLLMLVPAIALGAPPMPILLGPVDGGWASRSPEFDFRLPPPVPANTLGVEFEFTNESAVVIASTFKWTSSAGTDNHSPGPLPDAGLHGWRTRAWDDAGMSSAWTARWVFRMDDLAPALPASLTASLDGGVLDLTCAPVTDGESGLAYYHFGVSLLDQVDGGLGFDGYSPQPSTPASTFFLGPGNWVAGVHAHDVAGNRFGSSLTSGVLSVTTSASLPPPVAPVPVRSDGGVFPTFPYVPSDSVRFRVPNVAGTIGWSLVRRRPADPYWELVGSGPGPTLMTSLTEGPQDVRVAHLFGNEVSPWGVAVQVWVDEREPVTPSVTAGVDGGRAYVRWPSGRDANGSLASGVAEYRVTRCCVGDASVNYPVVMHQPDASFVVTDTPGLGVWTWSVVAVDRAGNASDPGSAVTVHPPPAPTSLRAVALVTNQPISLLWDEDRDGGTMQIWVATRYGDAGISASPPILMPALIDDAPEGHFSYVVAAQVGGLRGPGAQLDGVIRDVTAPQASTPTVVRRGARQAEVSWTASDALAGLRTVLVQRETNGGVVDLGVQTSPFLDTPADDGTHRYRVEATDLAGNVTTTLFGVDFVTPGEGVAIAPQEAQVLTCGKPFSLTLTTSEAAAWSLVDAPDGVAVDASGVLTWTPAATDVGTWTVRVRADAASSADERDLALEVDCTRRALAVSCGCSDVSGTAAWLALLLLAWCRRRAVEG